MKLSNTVISRILFATAVLVVGMVTGGFGPANRALGANSPNPAGLELPLKSQFVPSAFKTFAEWKDACARLPFNRQLRRGVAPRELLPLKGFREFDEAVEAFFNECKTRTLSQTNNWVGTVPTRQEFFNTEQVYFRKGKIGRAHV